MGVYIKGMEMPKPGAYTCELGVLDDNTAVLTIYTPINEPQKSYTLIPVQTHGLIDRERILDSIRIELAQVNAVNDMEDYDSWMRVFDYVRKFPTVIPSSEEAE